MLGREKSGEKQIAYGHHRLKAAQNLNLKEIPIEFWELDDAQMIKIMAQENMEEWQLSPWVAMETVKAAYNFLKQNQQLNINTAVDQIATFLSWTPKKIQMALEDLRAIGEIEREGKGGAKTGAKIEKEAVRSLPSQTHTSAFRRAVGTRKISPTVQKIAAKKFAQKGADRWEAERIIEETQRELGEKEPEPKEPKIPPKLDTAIKEVIRDIYSLESRCKKITPYLDQLSDYTKEPFLRGCESLAKLLQDILSQGRKEHEKKEAIDMA